MIKNDESLFKDNNIKWNFLLTFLVLFCLLLILPQVSSDDAYCYTPDTIDDSGTDTVNGDDLQIILDNYFGDGVVDDTTNQTQIQRWIMENTISLEFEYIQSEAGNNNIFGYYLNDSTFIEIFDNNNNDPNDIFLTTIPGSDINYIGFAIKSNGVMIYSENALNGDKDKSLALDHGDGYVLCFEDILIDSDDDFNDMVVKVNFHCVNNPPTANDDYVTTEEDIPVIIDVLSNDTDPENDSLIIESVTQGVYGGVVHDGNSITYTPNQDYCGSDEFTYNISDGQFKYDTATVFVTVNCVNDPPVAQNDFILVNEGETSSILTNGDFSLLENDTDTENDSLTAIKVTDPNYGTVIIFSNGSFIYTHDGSESTKDSFSYVANDGESDSNIAFVQVTINAINDQPIANDDIDTTSEDTQVITDVASNDIDNDSTIDLTSISIITSPTYGNVIVNLNGTVTYTPNSNFNGIDWYSYTIDDLEGATSNEAIVTITVSDVNDPPVCVDDVDGCVEDGSVWSDVLGNDGDVDGVLDVSSLMVVSGPGHGSTSVNSTSGLIQYVPDVDFFGSDSYVYSVADDDGAVDSAVVTISVGDVNDFPTAEFNYEPKNPFTLETIYLNSSSSDIDGTIVNWSWDMGDGNIIFGEEIIYQYADDGNYSIILTVIDDDGYVDSISDFIAVENRAPIVEDDIDFCNEDTSIWIDVLTNDFDLDGTFDLVSLTVISGPYYGIINVNTTTGEIFYSPNAEFHGEDTFSYTIMDDDGSLSNIATVNLTVIDVNDVPFTDFLFEPETPKTQDIIFFNSTSFDSDGTIVNWSWDMGEGTILYGEKVEIQYLVNGEYLVTLNVVDDDGAIGLITKSINVSNHPPYVVNDEDECDEDAFTWTNVLSNDYDVDGSIDKNSLSILSGPYHGSITINYDLGEIFYVPDADWFGVDSYVYSVADDNGAVGEAVVNISVLDVNDPPNANFNFEPINPSIEDIIYANSSSFDIDGNVINWTWDMGDGSLKYGEKITYQYSTNGIYDITLSVRDDDGSESSKMKQVSLGNLVPIAVDDTKSIFEDSSVVINLSTNDYDVDGELILDSITLVETPSNGSAIVLMNGSITYEPDDDFFGFDLFSYTIMDDDGAISNIASINITVIAINDDPVALDDFIEIEEGEICTILQDGSDSVLDNDSDADGDDLTVTILSYPSNGSLVLNSDGTFMYTHDGGESSIDSFSYKANDGLVDSNIAIVHIKINRVNNPPIVNDDIDSTYEDTCVFTNVCENDHDVDSALNLSSLTIVVSPNHGVAHAYDNGTVMYTPNTDYNGIDYYWYILFDNEGAMSDEALVTINILSENDAPIVDWIHPNDEETGVKLNPELIVQVTDVDNDLMNISFYNAKDDSFLGSVVNISSGNNASIIWSNREYSTEYSWYAIANDSHTQTVSETWKFTTKNEPLPGGSPTILSDNPPTSDASKSQQTGFINELLLFDGSNSWDDVGIVNYSWDFGDGKTGFGVTISHKYSSEGIYDVKLVVVDTEGKSDSDTITVVITKANNPPDEPMITGPTNGHKNVEYDFSISSMDLDDDMIQYIINWGDGNSTTTEFIENGSVTIQAHSWSEYGEYTIIIKASDGSSESASISYDIWIDVWPIDDVIKGHLVDRDSSEPYDVFDDEKTGKSIDINMDNGTYLIDIDDDGKNEYAFDLEDGLSTYQEYVYQKYLAIFEKEIRTPGFEIVGFIAMMIIALILYHRRRNS